MSSRTRLRALAVLVVVAAGSGYAVYDAYRRGWREAGLVEDRPDTPLRILAAPKSQPRGRAAVPEASSRFDRRMFADRSRTYRPERLRTHSSSQQAPVRTGAPRGHRLCQHSVSPLGRRWRAWR